MHRMVLDSGIPCVAATKDTASYRTWPHQLPQVPKAAIGQASALLLNNLIICQDFQDNCILLQR